MLVDAATLVGLAGTVTTVAAIEQGLPEYDPERIHHFRLTRAAAEDVFRTLATESADERRHNPGLEPERVDVIVGGAVVLVAILRAFELRRDARVARPTSSTVSPAPSSVAETGPKSTTSAAEGAENPAMGPGGVDEFLAVLRRLEPDDLAWSPLGSNPTFSVTRSTGGGRRSPSTRWCATLVAAAKPRTRRARAAWTVQEAARRGGIALPDTDVTRVARAAADVARGLAAGAAARPVTEILLEHWEPVAAGV